MNNRNATTRVTRETATRHRRRAWVTAGVVIATVVGVMIALQLGERPSGDTGNSQNTAAPAVGRPAPEGTFTTTDGQTRTIASLRGRPTLLWFIATWCPTCETAAQDIAAEIDTLRERGMRVVTLKLYQNLGQPGPSITEFAQQHAGSARDAPNWIWGDAPEELTLTYDARGYPDIYFLLDAQGRIQEINAAPSATALLRKAAELAGQKPEPIDGVQTVEGLSNQHVEDDVDYPQTPPLGGDHRPVWLNCGRYSTPVPDEHAVHSLEHGAVWITYRPNLPDAQVSALRDLVRDRPKTILSPYPGLPAPVVASAWGRQLHLDAPNDPRLKRFLDTYIDAEQAPEPGAACTGGVGTPDR
jgi:cytochrome oxidase Cu insertion factor (SCO1/SenC/PrrC family)